MIFRTQTKTQLSTYRLQYKNSQFRTVAGVPNLDYGRLVWTIKEQESRHYTFKRIATQRKLLGTLICIYFATRADLFKLPCRFRTPSDWILTWNTFLLREIDEFRDVDFWISLQGHEKSKERQFCNVTLKFYSIKANNVVYVAIRNFYDFGNQHIWKILLMSNFLK